MGRRVVVTGCGVVCAAGTELEPFWTTLLAGATLVRPLKRFSAPGLEAPVGAEVELALTAEADAADEREAYRARCAALARAAARRAVADAALPASREDLDRTGVVLGTTLGEERQVADLDEAWAARGADAVQPDTLERVDNSRLAALLARDHGLGGPAVLTASACSSGNAALAWAYDLVASGAADAMLAGGADTFTRLIYCGFHRMGALSKTVCRPFDRRRDGVSFGEGAGVLVLEELEHALRRGARVRAEVAGYGLSNDAYHVTAPEPNGEGFARAMREALATTGTAPADVGYVSAHGTGTPYNDLAETRALKAVLGEHARRAPVSSIKSMIGHTNGAASAIEAIACTLALGHQAIPPTAGLVEPDPECDLDYVPVARPHRFDTCLNLSAGFGGFNVCLVLKRFP